MAHHVPRKFISLLVIALVVTLISACNLSASGQAQETLQSTGTGTATGTILPTRTPQGTSGAPTPLPLTSAARPTGQVLFPTAVVVLPPTSRPPQIPTNTSVPVNIVILSPVPGNVVAGNVQVLGSATHPQFLQYQLEFGPDPNPGNLWYPATAAVTTPVSNGLLGIWNTTSVQDATYQLRLRVFLRDGTLLTTVVNNIRVQNRQNTPVPSATPNVPRPIAAFGVDRASGQVPLTVRFSNQSSGTINNIAWNFGDGTSSNEANPVHTFNAPGLYNVTLTVSGPGGSSNVSRQINVQSPSAPVAGFTMDKTSGLTPLTVQFTDTSTGTVTSYLWNFSDGTTSTDRNPSHTFTTPGTYNIFLTVTGPGGSSSVTRQITVTSAVPPTLTPSLTFTPTFTPTFTTTPVPPTATFTPTFTETPTETPIPPTATETPLSLMAGFTASPSAGDPLTILFTNTSSGPVSHFDWNFGDGNRSNEVNPVHTYAAPGTYDVVLTVTATDGVTTDTFATQVTVLAPEQPTLTFTPTFTETSIPPTATFTETPTETPEPPTETPIPPTEPPTETPEPLVAGFTAANAPGDPLTVVFTNTSTGPVSFFDWNFGDGNRSNEQNPVHTYAAPGTYDVVLTVTATDGVTTNTFSTQVTVFAPADAAFSAQNVPGSPLTVQFSDQSTGTIVARTWDFGDGSGSNEQNPVHTYAAPGTYTVTLTVTGQDGSTDQTAQDVTVIAPVDAQFTFSPVAGNPLSVQFSDQSTGTIVARSWDFGDGNGSNEQNPIHTYAAPGTYTVTLTVTGQDGSTDQTAQDVTVIAPVDAQFTFSPVAGNPLSVQFSDQSTGTIAARTWDFGDGNGSNEQNPIHTYAAPGTYTVTLTVTEQDGSTDQTAQDVTVTAPVDAQFTFSPVAGNPLSVQFSDQSTGTIVARTWDFGDGNGSNEQNPVHTYAAPGTYTVTLTVTGQDGSTDQTAQEVTLSQPLEAGFTFEPVEGDPLTIRFTNTSTGPVSFYDWNFGDGNRSNEENPVHTYAAPGTYDALLTVTATDGTTTNTFSTQVTVTAPTVEPTIEPTTDTSVPPSGIVAQTPVLPDFTQALVGNLQNIFNTGAAMGNRGMVFSLAGGDLFADVDPNSALLAPLGTGQYMLENGSLQAIIDWYNAGTLDDGTNSFTRDSAAASENWTAANLLEPNNFDDPLCQSGETPLACELRVTRPAVMLINVGSAEARQGADLTAFRASLQQIVQTVAANGTIPVLLTIPPRSDGAVPASQINAVNEVIIDVASQNAIPVINIWRALNDLPNSGLSGDGVNLSVSPSGGGDLSTNATITFGVNALNQTLLRALDALRTNIFPNAAA